jgi:hypothetical protein
MLLLIFVLFPFTFSIYLPLQKIADWAQGELSVTGEYSHYNNMMKIGKKLSKTSIFAIFH